MQHRYLCLPTWFGTLHNIKLGDYLLINPTADSSLLDTVMYCTIRYITVSVDHYLPV